MSEQVLNLYFSTVASMQVVMPRGKAIVFISGRYATSKGEEILFLDDLVENGTGTVFKNPSLLTINAADMDPMNALRNKFYAEFMAEKQAQLNPQNDRGNSEQGPLNAASTTSIAPVAAGGDATSLHSQVAKLIPGPKTPK